MYSFQPKQFGRYLLLDKIAVGGMAELYRAKVTGEEGFEKLVAIKKILPHLTAEDELVKAFIEEAKLAALLQHLNIIQVYDFGRMDRAYFIAMEFLFGKDLQRIVNKSSAKERPISLENALYVVSQICDGLDYAHSLKDLQGNPLNIIHRDISPQNIFITYDGQVKIIDFGIAKAAIQNTKTQAGIIKGKASYMSPEQAGGRTIDHRSDIFSAGILLFELVMHKQLFNGDMFQVLSQLREFEFELPENIRKKIPPPLYEILLKALAKDPEKRYQSGGRMRSDIEDYNFQISSRSNARSLAQYINELFKDEINAEKLVMLEATQIDSVKESTSCVENPIIDEKIEKTLILAPGEQVDPNPNDLRKYNENEEIKLEQAPKKRRNKFWYAAIPAALIVISVFLVYLFSENPESYKIKAGIAALNAGRFKEAVDLFKDVLGQDSSSKSKIANAYAQALEGRASEILITHPEEAEALLQKAVELNPGSKDVYLKLGLLHVKNKNYSKAVEYYEKAAGLDPQFAKTFFNLGYVYVKIKHYTEAKRMYLRVVELAPSFVDEALFNLAMINEKLGERKACMNNLKQAVAANPENEMAKQYLRRLTAKGEFLNEQ